MRIVFALVLFVGVAIAGGAVYLAMERFNQYETALANKDTKVVQKFEMKTVFVAAADLDYGKALTLEDVRAVQVPVDAAPETSFSDENLMLGSGEDRDFRTVIRAMDTGDFIMASKVTELGEDAGVSSRLSAGMRAFAIKVDVASGVSGFLRPGDRIDVYWTGQSDGETVTKLIMEGLTLIAIDQSAGDNRNRPTVARTVTVAANARTIAGLVQAQSTGKLLLSLRGVNDDTISEEIEVTKDDLLGREHVAAKKERVCTVRTRKGADVIQIPIPCNN
ncbi:MAG: Flp pilus assembly protein CpaB [Rhodobacteraceae bacterium]|nr:Flp pilus assembly protein CpaB [Paracoccaceae bacterium]